MTEILGCKWTQLSPRMDGNTMITGEDLKSSKHSIPLLLANKSDIARSTIVR